ncbi:MAG TPA: hypothetical protein PL151_10495 [Phycisphaerae bacterium]|nr:hypothetical protein [Phycisphaerae bacterium]HOQ85014.1 hypothetical protein [Phycisphaerae bacterium]HQE28180.1 hypothetical protein [Phycisphaerae bacterium]
MKALRLALITLSLPLLFGQMCGLSESVPDEITDTPTTDPDVQPPPAQAKTVTGPGFSLIVPPEFTVRSDIESDPQAGFEEYYGSAERLIVIRTETPPPGGPYTFSSACLRIQGGHITDSGDFILSAVKSISAQRAAESLAAYALLANGDLLCVEVTAGAPLGEQDYEFGVALFRTIILDDTDGRALENRLWQVSPKLLGITSVGLVVLDDWSAWRLTDDATAADKAELGGWARGSAIDIQVAGDHYELLQVGRYIPVPVRSLGLATSTTIAGYDSATRRLMFTNGESKPLLPSRLPTFWQQGDPVLLVRDQSTTWVIWSRTWRWLQL